MDVVSGESGKRAPMPAPGCDEPGYVNPEPATVVRRPGLIGRHLHMTVMWGLALAVGWHFHIWALAQMAVAFELMHQNAHAQKKHKGEEDWREDSWVCNLGFILLLLVLTHRLYLSWPNLGWQVLGGLLYGYGQQRAGAQWHKIVHARNKMSEDRISKLLIWIPLGLACMVLGVYLTS